MKVRKNRSALGWLAAIFEGGIRMMVGCFVLGIVFVVAVAFVSGYQFNAFRGRLPATGPRVPIPNVDAATLMIGKRTYQREDCSACHTLAGADSKDGRYGKHDAHAGPELTHEGKRNASVDWQITNLENHQRLYPNSIMPDYNDLPPRELRALASFMATRK